MLLRGFSAPLFTRHKKKSEKFNIHLSTALLLKALSECNTCCQSWIEPWVVRNNREMAFRSIIKLCYKCHPSSGMEFMHTYYYPGNSKGSADLLAWKQYNLSFFPSPPNSFWAIKFKNSNLHYNLWGCSTSNSFEMLCSVSPSLYYGGVEARSLFIWGHSMFDTTWSLMVWATPCSFEYIFPFGSSGRGQRDSGTVSDGSKLPCLTQLKGICKNKLLIIISATKVKGICSFKDRAAVRRHTIGWWTNENLSSGEAFK